MRRHGFLAGLFALAAAVCSQLPGQQPAGSLDEVVYRTPDGKIQETIAETKESAAGVSILVGGKVKDVISPAAIIRVEPKTLPGVDATALGLARTVEKNAEFAKALTEFGKLQKNLATAPERTRRYISFKEAMLTVKLADQKSGDEFKAEATKAAVKIAGFTRANKKSWEVWPAGRTAARLFTELGQYGDAAAILSDVASVSDLPKDLKAEATLAQAAALIRAKQGLTADGMLADLEKDASLSTPNKDRLIVLKVCAKLDFTPKTGEGNPKPVEPAKAVEAAIAAVKDPGARALAYNFLGDLYLANNMNRDAMWSYLWTDTVYNGDKEEQLYALHRLVKLAEAANDSERADFFQDRMVKARAN